jgi:acyl-CoA thioesterase FadM
MNVNFHRPVRVGRPIRAEGVVTRSRRKIVETSAELLDTESGVVLATATGTYVAAGDERKRALRERYGFRVLPGALPVSTDASS